MTLTIILRNFVATFFFLGAVGCTTSLAKRSIPNLSDYELCGDYKRHGVINVNQGERERLIRQRNLDCNATKYTNAEADSKRRFELSLHSRQSQNPVDKVVQTPWTDEMQADYQTIFGETGDEALSGFTISTDASCVSSDSTVTYQYEFVDSWSIGVDAVVFASKDVLDPDISMGATHDRLGADLVLAPNLKSAAMRVCKSSGLSTKQIFVTQDPQYQVIADVKVRLVGEIPVSRDNFYIIFVDESESNTFTPLESVGLAPAIWFLNE